MRCFGASRARLLGITALTVLSAGGCTEAAPERSGGVTRSRGAEPHHTEPHHTEPHHTEPHHTGPHYTGSYVAEPARAEKSDAPRRAPPSLIAPLESGIWRDPADRRTLQRVWVDARVANLRFEKRVFVEFVSTYQGGRAVRSLHPASFKSKLGADERWGTDSIEIYRTHGGRALSATHPPRFRLRMQSDDPESMSERIFITPWQLLDEAGAATEAPALEPTDAWSGALSVPIAQAPRALEPEVLFSPYDDPGARIISELEQLIRLKQRAPEERVTFYAAVFNINEPEMIDAVIRAHRAGVEVRLLMDGRKFRPWYAWYQGDDLLLDAGVPLLGVRYPGRGAMHNKFMLFNGALLITGSMNWEYGARHHNHENIVLSRDPELLAAYHAQFRAIAGGVKRPRSAAHDPQSPLSVSFAPHEASHELLGELIDQAEQQILVAMFTAKDVRWQENGRETSLFEKLIAAHQRGIEVKLVIDHGVHEANEYYGVYQEDDPLDEWLEAQGISVIRADNPRSRYASMHHKFMVVDGEITVTGAYNWYYDSAYLNDEDQLIIRSPEVAALYVGEIVDLLAQYDPGYEPLDWPQRVVSFEVDYPHSREGDQLILVGDLAELGAWSWPDGVQLSGADWPTWRAELTLPGGIRSAYKIVLLTRTGQVVWERAPNRLLTVDPRETETRVQVSPRY